MSATFDCCCQVESLSAKFSDVGHEDDAVENSYTKERDEADSSRDAERHTSKEERNDTSRSSQRNVQEDQERRHYGLEVDIEENEDDVAEMRGKQSSNSLRSILLIF